MKNYQGQEFQQSEQFGINRKLEPSPPKKRGGKRGPRKKIPSREFGKGLATVSEVASYLRRSESAVYHLCYREMIPHIKLGRSTVFDPAQIMQWIKENTIKSKS